MFCPVGNGQPAELLVDDRQRQLRRQDIVIGMIRQVTPALDSVFVDIGEAHDAMLPLSEAAAGVKAGQPVIVQIKREAASGKGHQVTSRIQLPGPYAVFQTQGSAKRRSKLRAFPPEQQTQLFLGDLERLEAIWRQIQQESRSGTVPRLLSAFGEPLYTALISFASASLRRIRVEGDDLFRQVYNQVRELMPAYLPLLSLYIPSRGYGLSAALGLGSLPDSLARRKIWLDGGGFLVIDRTEALTVIDVNSGKDVRGQESAGLRCRTNLQAAAEIGRQLRLRNIGGVIVIDFINLAAETDRQDVQDALKAAMLSDRARFRLVGFTGLGLFEMTRTAL